MDAIYATPFKAKDAAFAATSKDVAFAASMEAKDRTATEERKKGFERPKPPSGREENCAAVFYPETVFKETNARVGHNPVPESTLFLSQGLRISKCLKNQLFCTKLKTSAHF
jgi:hypothetical protein